MKKLLFCFFLIANFSLLAQVGFNITPSTGCGPLDVNFDFTGSPGGIVSLYYDTGDGGELYDNRTATFNYTYTEIGTYTVIMYALDAQDELVDFATGTVTVTGANAGVVNPDVSIGDKSEFYVDGDADSVVWDFGDGFNSTELNPEHIYGAPGTYTVTATIESASCGTIVNTITVNISDVNFSMNPLTGCAPQDVTFTYTGTLAGAANYYWDYGNGESDFGPDLDSVTHNFTLGGTYLVALYLLDANFNTIGYATKNLSLGGISITPSLSVTGIAQDIEFISGGISGSTVSWDFGDGGSSTALSPTHSYAAPGTYTVTLTAVSPVCGSQVATTIITITDNTLSITVTAGCNAPYQVDFQVSGAIAPAYLEWYFGDDSTAQTTISTSSHTYLNEGQYFAYVNMYDSSFNYLGSLVQLINLGNTIQVTNPYPSVGENIDFVITGDATSATWDFGDTGTSSVLAPAYTYASGGSFTVTATIITPACGTITRTQQIEVRDIGYTLSGTSGCAPLEVTLSYVGTDPDVSFFEWDFGDGQSSFGPTASAGNTYTQAGTYTIAVVAYDNVFNVLSYKTYEVNINGTAEDFDLAVTGNLDVCGSGSVTLSSPVLGSYTWSNGANTQSITVSAAGDYSLSVLNGTCTAQSYTETFTINPLPSVFAGYDTIGCINFGFNLTLSGSGADSYIWNNGVVDGVNFVPPMDTTFYTVTGTDTNGCIGQDSIRVISQICMGIEENALTEMKIYPNPVDEILHVSLSQETVELSVSNLLGEVLFTVKATINTEIDMSQLQSGTYFLKALDKQGSLLGIEKVIVN